MSTKLYIVKFDDKISFSIWQVQMKAVLTQLGVRKALSAKPVNMTDDQWEDLDQKAFVIASSSAASSAAPTYA